MVGGTLIRVVRSPLVVLPITGAFGPSASVWWGSPKKRPLPAAG
jgi:hypothetical protein